MGLTGFTLTCAVKISRVVKFILYQTQKICLVPLCLYYYNNELVKITQNVLSKNLEKGYCSTVTGSKQANVNCQTPPTTPVCIIINHSWRLAPGFFGWSCSVATSSWNRSKVHVYRLWIPANTRPGILTTFMRMQGGGGSAKISKIKFQLSTGAFSNECFLKLHLLNHKILS